MKNNMVVWDIESSALSPAELAAIEPEFKAPANYRDAAKIAAYIAESRASWRDRAALSALTGRVLAIGIRQGGESKIWGVESEADMLQLFWDRFSDDRLGEHYVGFSIKNFDLPFLVQRSFVKGIQVPYGVIEGRYWHHRFIDLQERWLCFGRESTGASLDAVCRACGLGVKTGSGADFSKLWSTDRDAAIAYLHRDLELCAKLAERLL